ncbi:MAG: hypothetical protein VBE63_23865 [Lamprobacter sp.]|uniref:hypothetical protein n=1 Tax=Lamprobacter sp. TaxID=3100796 RepID=UPI002B2614B5|nr:hypothetical protein [Lamprobacter sp.]MEA3642953.1 hypothetical protein [Lamprobacter sp.]
MSLDHPTKGFDIFCAAPSRHGRDLRVNPVADVVRVAGRQSFILTAWLYATGDILAEVRPKVEHA